MGIYGILSLVVCCYLYRSENLDIYAALAKDLSLNNV